MRICNRTTTVIAVNAEHPVGRAVGDHRELMLFLVHLECAVARLTERQLFLIGGMRKLGRLNERDGIGRCQRTQDRFEITVTSLVG